MGSPRGSPSHLPNSQTLTWSRPTISSLDTVPVSSPVPNNPFSLWKPWGSSFQLSSQGLIHSRCLIRALGRILWLLHLPRHSHHRAGVAASLAALTNEEGAISLAAQHFLSLCAVDLAHVPGAFLMVG